MIVNEIFASIQGEGTETGLPTVFVRFTGCNLRCQYCDTTYAYEEGQPMSPREILTAIQGYGLKGVCLTGGEPLNQDPKELGELLSLLGNYRVVIETNGSVPLPRIFLNPNHRYVMDLKSPSSGCEGDNCYANLELLRPQDELKLVLGDRADYQWARDVIRRHGLEEKLRVSLSPVYPTLDPKELIAWILTDGLDVRFQVQLHKIIWGSEVRGV